MDKEKLATAFWVAVLVVAGVSFSQNSWAQEPSDEDLFESEKINIIQNSPVRGDSSVFDMFGAEDASFIPGLTIFSSGQPKGTVHGAEWFTETPVRLERVVLFAEHNPYVSLGRDADWYGFASYKLYGQKPDGNWQLLDETTPPNPYGGGPEQNELIWEQTLSEPFVGQRFKVEFLQRDTAVRNYEGPIIKELDGFGEALPDVGPPEQSDTDLWQHTDILVFSHSPVLERHATVFDIRNMFGGVFADYEENGISGDDVTIFSDDENPGFPHKVMWKTISPIRLDSFALHAEHALNKTDPSDVANAEQRGFSRFELFAKNNETNEFDLIYTYHPANPYGQGENLNELALEHEFEESIEAQEFKAIFYQYGRVNSTSGGPAVVELDGFGESLGNPGNSNVLFLPGFQASRLYRDGVFGEDQLWVPTRDQDAGQLFLNDDGTSVDPDIYTKDILDEAYSLNIYKGFIKFMDEDMVDEGIINEWQAHPYDWRLPLDELAAEQALIQRVEDLAASSQNGKVTIIGHSNGGNLGKLLLNNPVVADKVDKIILVATPQLGTPKAIGSLLHGYKQSIAAGFFLGQETAREFGENMISAYTMLPTPKYFAIVADPVISFDQGIDEEYQFSSLYNGSIDSFAELEKFVLGDDGARDEPASNDLHTANVLDSLLFSRASSIQDQLDSWQAPGEVEVIQIAGWGLDTVKGFEYSLKSCPECGSNSGPFWDVEPIFTFEGDQTVVTASAAALNSSEFYLDLVPFNGIFRSDKNHANILEASPVTQLLNGIITMENTGGIDYISEGAPPTGSRQGYRLRMKSPVNVHVYDNDGNHVGPRENSDPDSDIQLYDEEIPNSSYLEFGSKKYISLDDGDTYKIKLDGEDAGKFTFELDELSGDNVTNTISFANIPTTSKLAGELSLDPENFEQTSLSLDFEGDGEEDVVLAANEEISSTASVQLLQQAIQEAQLPRTIEMVLRIRANLLERFIERESTRPAKNILDSMDRLIAQMTDAKGPVGISEEEARPLREIIAVIKESL